MVPMLLIAALVGVAGALAVEGFREAMRALMRLYTDQDHLVIAAAGLPHWERVLVPTVVAFAAGLAMWAGQRWVRRPRGLIFSMESSPPKVEITRSLMRSPVLNPWFTGRTAKAVPFGAAPRTAMFAPW